MTLTLNVCPVSYYSHPKNKKTLFWDLSLQINLLWHRADFHLQCRPQTLIPLWSAPWQLPGHDLHSTPWSPAHHPPGSRTTQTRWFAIKRDKQLEQKWLDGHLGTSEVRSVLHLDSLVQVQRYHFLHAVLDHLRGEKVGFSLFVYCDLPEVFQQNRTDGFGGMGHVDGSIVANHLTHVGQSATVIQVKMAERSNKCSQVKTLTFLQIRKIWTTTDLIITQSKKSVRRPFWIIYEKSGKRLWKDNTDSHSIQDSQCVNNIVYTAVHSE